jgi:hypothetical protein
LRNRAICSSAFRRIVSLFDWFETRSTTGLPGDPIQEAFMHLSLPLVLLTVAALLTSCRTDATRESETEAPDLAGGGSGPSASGHVEHFIEGCCVEKYSFDAHYLGDGSVHGTFNVRDFFIDGSEKAFAKGRVTCFTVDADGKTARLGGVVEAGNPPEFVGTEARWIVRDNGEGQNEPRDEATDLVWGFPPRFNAAARNCAGLVPFSSFGVFGPIERGNVQVRP